MTWAIVLFGAILLVGAGVAALLAPSKVVLGLFAAGVLVVVTFVALAVAQTDERPPLAGGSWHAQLEADRIMTERMATVVGSGMDAQMAMDGMLQRSSSDAYLRALELHVSQVDRMLGRTP